MLSTETNHQKSIGYSLKIQSIKIYSKNTTNSAKTKTYTTQLSNTITSKILRIVLHAVCCVIKKQEQQKNTTSSRKLPNPPPPPMMID